jgi:UDP-N-acetyl-D-glucosamine dehydrogenase
MISQYEIAVFGLGYVGLPLSIAAAESGFKVIGIDINEEKLELLRDGISTTSDVSDMNLKLLQQEKTLKLSSNHLEATGCSIYIICVPTPLDPEHRPDLSFVFKSIEFISSIMTAESLVILESTVEPGTTRKLLIPKISSISGIDAEKVKIAFSPERIDPANGKWNLKNTVKIVAGVSEESKKEALDFYSKFIDTVYECDSLEVAETAKLLENSFRLINISFINELSVFCNKMGISILEVINAAASKPYGYMPFYPSVGIGGHCIPVDPLYLANKAVEIGAETKMIDLANKINLARPKYFVNRAREILGDLKGRNILVIGVSYKPDVADTRESPVETLIDELRLKGAKVSWHDDIVKNWRNEKSVKLSSSYDLAILTTPHTYLNLIQLGDVPLINTRESN